MKLRVFVSLFMITSLVLFGCEKEKTTKQTSVEDVKTNQVEPTDKPLVVYFSRAGEQYNVGQILEGNTAIVAKLIAKKTGADLYEVRPKVDEYNLSYKQLALLAKKEQDLKKRPEYLKPAPDFSQYDDIFIGAPVWWSDWPMIMYSFFEDNDLQGKKLIPFATHAGSELSRFDYRLAYFYPYCTVLKGIALLGENVQNDPNQTNANLDSWLQELGFVPKSGDNSNEAPLEAEKRAEDGTPELQEALFAEPSVE